MPQLEEILQSRKAKKFTKKKYRPWDLSGNEDPNSENTEAPVAENEANTPPKKTAPKPVVEKVEKPKPTLVTAPPAEQQKTRHLDNKIDNIKITKRQHLDNNEITQREHLDNIKLTQREHLGNDLDNDLDNKMALEMVKKLTGIQAAIFFYIVEICCARGLLETGCILTLDIAEAANCSYGSAKMSLKRLIDKGLLTRQPGKRSKGGHINLRISTAIRHAAMQAKQDSKTQPILHRQIVEKIKHLDNDLDNNTDNNSAIYNNNINNIIINKLPDEWKAIDISPLADIGFSENHIQQIYNAGRSTPDIVQQSIFHFAFALEHRHDDIAQKYKGPVNALMSVLIKGNCWYEDKYESPQQKAMRLFLDAEKKKKADMQTMINELVALEFPRWREQLSEQQLRAIVPGKFVGKNSPVVEMTLRSHFIEQVLKPKLKAKGLW